MGAPVSANDFLEALEESRLLAPRYLQRLRMQQSEMPDQSVSARVFAQQLCKRGILTDFQVNMLLQGKGQDLHIGKFKVLELLGAGGMGRVYLAEHTLMNRAVALKVIHPSRASSQAAVSRFAREARAAAALKHVNVVQAFDFDFANGLYFISMEYIEGMNFQDLVERYGPVPIPQAANYICQAAAGLHHAHRAGLVHRDIKPSNLIVEPSGTVKLLDLGLVTQFKEQEGEEMGLTLTEGDTVLGTVDYISPEQARNSHKVDHRTDIYSLGGVFYFLLTGKTLFTNCTPTIKMLLHQTTEPAPVTSMRKEVPSQLAQVVHKMLAKKPKERFQSLAEVFKKLRPFAGTVKIPFTRADIRYSLPVVARYLRFSAGFSGEVGTPSGFYSPNSNTSFGKTAVRQLEGENTPNPSAESTDTVSAFKRAQPTEPAAVPTTAHARTPQSRTAKPETRPPASPSRSQRLSRPTTTVPTEMREGNILFHESPGEKPSDPLAAAESTMTGLEEFPISTSDSDSDSELAKSNEAASHPSRAAGSSHDHAHQQDGGNAGQGFVVDVDEPGTSAGASLVPQYDEALPESSRTGATLLFRIFLLLVGMGIGLLIISFIIPPQSQDSSNDPKLELTQ